MLDLQPHEQEINATNDNVLQMILGLGVLELYMQTILNSNIHLDRTIGLGRHSIRVDPEILLTDDISHSPRDRYTDKVSQLHVDSIVGLVLLLDVFEIEGEVLGVLEFAGCC